MYTHTYPSIPVIFKNFSIRNYYYYYVDKHKKTESSDNILLHYVVSDGLIPFATVMKIFSLVLRPTQLITARSTLFYFHRVKVV